LPLFGSVTPLYGWLKGDENEAGRIPVGVAATGVLRSRNAIKTSFRFVRFEPFVLLKKS